MFLFEGRMKVLKIIMVFKVFFSKILIVLNDIKNYIYFIIFMIDLLKIFKEIIQG